MSIRGRDWAKRLPLLWRRKCGPSKTMEHARGTRLPYRRSKIHETYNCASENLVLRLVECTSIVREEARCVRAISSGFEESVYLAQYRPGVLDEMVLPVIAMSPPNNNALAHDNYVEDTVKAAFCRSDRTLRLPLYSDSRSFPGTAAISLAPADFGVRIREMRLAFCSYHLFLASALTWWRLFNQGCRCDVDDRFNVVCIPLQSCRSVDSFLCYLSHGCTSSQHIRLTCTYYCQCCAY